MLKKREKWNELISIGHSKHVKDQQKYYWVCLEASSVVQLKKSNELQQMLVEATETANR